MEKFSTTSFNKLLIGILPVMLGCATLSPKENFRNFLESSIGTNVKDKVSYDIGWEGNLNQSKTQTNGNQINEYIFKNPHGECIYSLEIDATGKILNWKILKNEDACQIAP